MHARRARGLPCGFGSVCEIEIERESESESEREGQTERLLGSCLRGLVTDESTSPTLSPRIPELFGTLQTPTFKTPRP